MSWESQPLPSYSGIHLFRASCIFLAVVAALTACGSNDDPAAPSATLLDQDVALIRGEARDSGTRVVSVDGPSIIIAIVEERGTDVTLRIGGAKADAFPPGTAVESNLEGEGLEIAALVAGNPGTYEIKLDGPRNSLAAGHVHLRVLRFSATASRDARAAARLAGYQQWALGTQADIPGDRVAAEVLPQLDRAIATFESAAAADAPLAAMARLIRARTFYFHELDQVEARNEARRAADAFSSVAVSDPLNAARARLLEAAALQEISRDSKAQNPSAAEADQESRSILARLTAQDSALDEVGRARAFNLLGLVNLYRQQWSMARDMFESAVQHYDAAGYSAGSRQSNRNLALLANQRGDLALAARLYEERLKELAWIDNPDIRTSLLTNAGLAATNVGDSDAAIARFLQAQEIAGSAQSKVNEARALHGLGLEYYARGDIDQAETLLTKALELRRTSSDAPGIQASLRAVGALQRNRNEPGKALESHLAALKHAPSILAQLRTLLDIALDEAAAANNPSAIAYLRQALDLKFENPALPPIAEAQLALADLLLRESGSGKNIREARQLATSALEVASKLTDIPVEISARRILARVHIARGERPLARQQLETAIDLALRYRRFSSSVELQASSLASQQQIFRDYISLLMEGVPNGRNPHVASSDEARALRTLENARALMFAGRRKPDASSHELDTALSTLAAKRVSIVALLDRARPPAEEIATLQFDSAKLRAKIDRLRASNPADANSLEPDRATEAWRPLEAGRAQISYFLGDERAYAWERTAGGIRVWVLPARPADIERHVRELGNTDPRQRPAKYDENLLALTPLLLPKGIAGAGVTSIDIVADGQLTRVPFAGLGSPTDPSRRLIETHAVRVIASLFRTPATPASSRRWNLVGLSDDAQTTSLTHAGSEVQAVAEALGSGPARVAPPQNLLLDGTSASTQLLERAVREGANVMHFATHGDADVRQPLASRLTLHGDKDYLTAGQIQEWRGDVGLVFLSACDTAVGPTRFGDSMPGLQRAFLRAGARDVIATLWPIEDRLAADFARDFYRLLGTGIEPAEALARTQRAWLVSANDESQQIYMRRRIGAWAYALYSP